MPPALSWLGNATSVMADVVRVWFAMTHPTALSPGQSCIAACVLSLRGPEGCGTLSSLLCVRVREHACSASVCSTVNRHITCLCEIRCIAVSTCSIPFMRGQLTLSIWPINHAAYCWGLDASLCMWIAPDSCVPKPVCSG